MGAVWEACAGTPRLRPSRVITLGSSKHLPADDREFYPRVLPSFSEGYHIIPVARLPMLECITTLPEMGEVVVLSLGAVHP